MSEKRLFLSSSGHAHEFNERNVEEEVCVTMSNKWAMKQVSFDRL